MISIFKVASVVIFMYICIDRIPVLSQNRSRGGFLEFLFGNCKCKCGLPNRQARLIGGEYLRNYEFPWLAILQIKEKYSVFGTLINNKYVITGASALAGLSPFDVKVTLGQQDRCTPDVSSLNVSVEKVIIHKEFNPTNKAHDIALLKLSSSIIFEKRILPICLSSPDSTYVGQVATFVGWEHFREENKHMPNCRLRKVGLPVLDFSNCYQSLHVSNFLTTDKRCAGIIGTKNVICQVDEGGPVMYRSYGGIYELIGIIHNKNDCNDENTSTTLFTSINDYLTWITSNTLDACYCLKTR
ncbi:hypothetical protein FQA39_LY13275 [Lamprigera yunnana]|nr:hypothetical protein FQA39_LY13275 [Lamprigera yunnana]